MLPSLAKARRWTEAGVEVTLIDPHRWLYYSGMVPEHLGGVYDVDEVRIDLQRLAGEAGIDFVHQPATAIDPDERTVATGDGRQHPYDLLAVDVGGVNPAVPDPAIATKPISRIRDLEPRLREVLGRAGASLRLVVAGAGAAGTEVALNVTGRFQRRGRLGDLEVALVEQAGRVLPGFPEGMRQYAGGLLRRRGAAVHQRSRVGAVRPAAGDGTATVTIEGAGGGQTTRRADAVLWATGVVGPPLLRESGLPTDDRGFLRVRKTLQTRTHPRIFAAGDCATIDGSALQKVGVHAVKQGPDLRENLDRALSGLQASGSVPDPGDLRPFRPYPVAPLILSTGARCGLWTAGSLWAAHPWLLRLKHWIDRDWIRDYAREAWRGATWRDLLGAESAATGDCQSDGAAHPVR
jgi:selenide,water dikinase